MSSPLSLHGLALHDKETIKSEAPVFDSTQSCALSIIPPPLSDPTPCLRHISMMHDGFLVVEDYIAVLCTSKTNQYYYSKNVFWVQYARRSKIDLPEKCDSAFPLVKQNRIDQAEKLRNVLKQCYNYKKNELFNGLSYSALLKYVEKNKDRLNFFPFLQAGLFSLAKSMIKSRKNTLYDVHLILKHYPQNAENPDFLEIISLLKLSELSENDRYFLIRNVLEFDGHEEEKALKILKLIVNSGPFLSLSGNPMADLKFFFRKGWVELIPDSLKSNPDTEFSIDSIQDTISVLESSPDLTLRCMKNVHNLDARNTMLELACRRRYSAVFDYAVKEGWSIGDHLGAIALQWGSIYIAKEILLQIRLNILTIDDYEISEGEIEFFTWAAITGNREIVQELMSLDWEIPNDDRQFAIYSAAKNGHQDVVAFLARYPLDNTYRVLSLFEAARRGNADMVRVLRPNLLDADRRTDVLLSALDSQNDETIQLILRSGPISINDKNRCKIIKAAAKAGHIQTINMCQPHLLNEEERGEALKSAMEGHKIADEDSRIRFLLGAESCDIDRQHNACFNYIKNSGPYNKDELDRDFT